MKFLIYCSLSLLFSQNIFSKEGPKKLKSVFIKTAKKQEIFDSFAYPATVEAVVNALVISESQGIVERISSPLGQKVKINESLVKVRHTDPIYKYKPVTLKAPVSGVVSQVFVSEGSLVSKGQKILQVTDPDKIKVKIEIGAKDLQFIKKGLEGNFTSKANSKDIKLRVLGVSPFVNPATGTATAELELSSIKDKLIPGVLGKVVFKSNIHQGFVFVENAIYYLGKKTYVRLTEELENKYLIKKVEVKLGQKRRGQVEILSGLKDGMMVIERASGFLPEGAEVAIGNLPKVKTKKVGPKKETKKEVKAKL